MGLAVSLLRFCEVLHTNPHLLPKGLEALYYGLIKGAFTAQDPGRLGAGQARHFLTGVHQTICLVISVDHPVVTIRLVWNVTGMLYNEETVVMWYGLPDIQRAVKDHRDDCRSPAANTRGCLVEPIPWQCSFLFIPWNQKYKIHTVALIESDKTTSIYNVSTRVLSKK